MVAPQLRRAGLRFSRVRLVEPKLVKSEGW
jgi:hypothetical protein